MNLLIDCRTLARVLRDKRKDYLKPAYKKQVTPFKGINLRAEFDATAIP